MAAASGQQQKRLASRHLQVFTEAPHYDNSFFFQRLSKEKRKYEMEIIALTTAPKVIQYGVDV